MPVVAASRCGLNVDDRPKADLQSELGSHPHEFESRILRCSDRGNAETAITAASAIAQIGQGNGPTVGSQSDTVVVRRDRICCSSSGAVRASRVAAARCSGASPCRPKRPIARPRLSSSGDLAFASGTRQAATEPLYLCDLPSVAPRAPVSRRRETCS
jgi:hypothetical protein